jgi:hypothetical protein
VEHGQPDEPDKEGARLDHRPGTGDRSRALPEDAPIFPKDDGSTKKSQSTLTVGLVYGFSGKI